MSTYTSAYQALAAAQKHRKGVSVYSRWVNRPLGRVFAAAAYQIGISPNTVTAFSALCTAAALLAMVSLPVEVGTGLLVSVLLVLGFALDSADGQVARLAGRSSPAGEWLDHTVDAAKMVAVHGAVAVAWWRHTDLDAGWLLIPLAFQLVAVTLFSGGTVAELLLRGHGDQRRHAAVPSTARALVLLPADFGVLALCMLLWGFTGTFLAAYTALLAMNTLLMIALLVRWFRTLGRLGRQHVGAPGHSSARGLSP